MPSLFIDGEWTSPKSGATQDVVNPSDGSVVQQVDVADDGDVQRAISAARRAFDKTDWPRTPVSDRVALLNKVADLLERDRDKVARAETLNTGKALRESCWDVDDVIKVFRYYASLADKEQGRLVATPGAHAVARIPRAVTHGCRPDDRCPGPIPPQSKRTAPASSRSARAGRHC